MVRCPPPLYPPPPNSEEDEVFYSCVLDTPILSQTTREQCINLAFLAWINTLVVTVWYYSLTSLLDELLYSHSCQWVSCTRRPDPAATHMGQQLFGMQCNETVLSFHKLCALTQSYIIYNPTGWSSPAHIPLPSKEYLREIILTCLTNTFYVVISLIWYPSVSGVGCY